VPAATMAGLKEIYTRGTDPVISPALAAEQDIAGSAGRDFAGLSGRFDDVTARNRAQIATD
jgi:enoyl-CoA hydratase